MTENRRPKPIPRVYVGERAIERLRQLDLTPADLRHPLLAAAGDARLCTRFDSPTQAPITMWSRTNRYLREGLVPRKWKYNNQTLILRTVHPKKRFAITAMSGSGQVGEPDASHVQCRNLKGGAVQDVVERNGQIELDIPDLPSLRKTRAGQIDLPTWMLLYKWTDEGIHSELSLPGQMTGRIVDGWIERIPLEFLPMDRPDNYIEVDSPDYDNGVEVDVEFTG